MDALGLFNYQRDIGIRLHLRWDARFVIGADEFGSVYLCH